jgi:hypothetical protein
MVMLLNVSRIVSYDLIVLSDLSVIALASFSFFCWYVRRATTRMICTISAVAIDDRDLRLVLACNTSSPFFPRTSWPGRM